MNNSYNLLMTKRINMINQDLNEEYIRKFNLSIDTIKRKKKRKLSTRELDDLKYIIKDLQKIPKDERFQDYILRHLKVFLIYGNVKRIDNNTIVLDLTNGEETSILQITVNKNYVTFTLKGNNYKEEAIWKSLDIDDYYTKYQRKETDVYTNRNTSLYQTTTADNYPMIILSEVQGSNVSGNTTWYKIQSDPTLNASRTGIVQDKGDYDFNNFYKYVGRGILHLPL